MKNKIFMFCSVGLLMVLLTGCSEAEEILGKVNQILDQQLGEETEETEGEETQDENGEVDESTTIPVDTNNDTDVDPVENVMSDGHENEADPMLSFKERLQQAGYSKIDPPNGLRIPLPLDWVLVQVIKEDPAWEGVFCFDTQLEETIASTEESLRAAGFDIISDPITIDSDNVHSTKYSYEEVFESGQGDMIYFIDNYGTTCSTVYLEINNQ